MTSKLDNLADQGPGAIVTFNTALHLLKCPAQFLSSKGGEQKTLAVWSTLYQTLVEQGEMSVNHTTSFIASEMGDRMESILQVKDSPGQLAMHAKCNKVMMEFVDWSSLARMSTRSTRWGLLSWERKLGSLSGGWERMWFL
jgi:ATPase subunit of ABC transporter with duplicated ATPase domains